MPLISKADKQRVLGAEPELPPDKIFDGGGGMPLYWQERKPVEFWKDILYCLDAGVVVDMFRGLELLDVRASAWGSSTRRLAARVPMRLGWRMSWTASPVSKS